MNYRHAFHAGNAADCFKHAVLVWMLRAMARKDTPFMVLDTHGGIGRYDLNSIPARRTDEAAHGILRLRANPQPALADYLHAVEVVGLYPGSPALIGAMLRPGDRGVACELHPQDFAILKNTCGRNPKLALHLRDGYEAIGAFMPPPERRGLLLIDPPYEKLNDFDMVFAGLRTAISKFPSCVAMAWYPIKHRAPVRAFHDALRQCGIRDIVAAEVFYREPSDPTRLNGSGLAVINPPYLFEAEIRPMLEALLLVLGDREVGEGTALIRLADE